MKKGHKKKTQDYILSNIYFKKNFNLYYKNRIK